MKKVSSMEEFKTIEGTEPFYFLKNSTTCPISGSAYEEVKNFSDDHSDIQVYYLNVQEARPLSTQLAEELGVKHESPQLFLIKDGKVLAHDSHWNITYDKLEKLTKDHVR